MVKVIEKDKPLPEHTKLDYYECYAKIVLEEMFHERFSDLIILDKPDLQNEQLNIGVEVTSSINPKQKEAEALYVKWYDQGNEGKKKIERQIKKCGAELIKGVLGGIPVMIISTEYMQHLIAKWKSLKNTSLLANNIRLSFPIYTQLLLCGKKHLRKCNIFVRLQVENSMRYTFLFQEGSMCSISLTISLAKGKSTRIHNVFKHVVQEK